MISGAVLLTLSFLCTKAYLIKQTFYVEKGGGSAAPPAYASDIAIAKGRTEISCIVERHVNVILI